MMRHSFEASLQVSKSVLCSIVTMSQQQLIPSSTLAAAHRSGSLSGNT